MTKFSHVIIRRPGKSLSNGITSAPELGQPIYERAIEEHYDYEHALEQCGVDVSVLPALEQYPDSCFVEDPAVITRCGAIITNPGADSRNGEKDEIEPAVRRFFDDEHVKHIVSLRRFGGTWRAHRAARRADRRGRAVRGEASRVCTGERTRFHSGAKARSRTAKGRGSARRERKARRGSAASVGRAAAARRL